VPGCYALNVNPDLPQHIEDLLESHGRKVVQPDAA
jgi:hypothetical protein